ncbi:hypothetical protein BDF14DRAFT_1751794 [Spinellus fusiger]|nr:hypothetical protein BDF14DRAFT_1751794 [Spinellus fusiger]
MSSSGQWWSWNIGSLCPTICPSTTLANTTTTVPSIACPAHLVPCSRDSCCLYWHTRSSPSFFLSSAENILYQRAFLYFYTSVSCFLPSSIYHR